MVDDGEYSDAEFEEWSRIVWEDEGEKEGKLSDQEGWRNLLCEDEPSGDHWEIQDEEGSGRGDLDP